MLKKNMRASQFFLAIVVSVLTVYLCTLCPTVSGGDSGEFILVGSTLSIAHPPGYPLYTLLSKFFSLIPIGSIAWRINFFSSVCDAFSAGAIFLTIRELLCLAGIDEDSLLSASFAGGIGAGLFAFSPLVWRYAVIAEVFALHNLLTVASLYSMVRYLRRRETWVVIVAMAMNGLALGHHHTFVFYLGSWLFFWLWIVPRKDWKSLAVLGLCLSLGFLLPYLYLYIVAQSHSHLSWGNASHFQGIVRHVFRAEYGTFRLGVPKLGSSGDVFSRLALYFKDFPSQSLWVGWAFIPFGAVRLYGASRALFWSILCGLLIYLFGFHFLANTPITTPLDLSVQARFWQQSNLIGFILIGLGFGSVFEKLKNKLSPMIALGITSILLLTQVLLHYQEQDQSQNYSLRDYAKAILEPLSEKSILLVVGDLNANTIRYVQELEGFRTDVKVVLLDVLPYVWYNDVMRRKFPDLILPGSRYQPGKAAGYIESGLDAEKTQATSYSMGAFLAANIERFPMAIIDGFNPMDVAEVSRSFRTVPQGLASQILLRSETANSKSLPLSPRIAAAPLIDEKTFTKFSPDRWEWQALQTIVSAKARAAHQK